VKPKALQPFSKLWRRVWGSAVPYQMGPALILPLPLGWGAHCRNFRKGPAGNISLIYRTQCLGMADADLSGGKVPQTAMKG
jgi:hypothetical protein